MGPFNVLLNHGTPSLLRLPCLWPSPPTRCGVSLGLQSANPAFVEFPSSRRPFGEKILYERNDATRCKTVFFDVTSIFLVPGDEYGMLELSSMQNKGSLIHNVIQLCIFRVSFSVVLFLIPLIGTHPGLSPPYPTPTLNPLKLGGKDRRGSASLFSQQPPLPPENELPRLVNRACNLWRLGQTPHSFSICSTPFFASEFGRNIHLKHLKFYKFHTITQSALQKLDPISMGHIRSPNVMVAFQGLASAKKYQYQNSQSKG